MKFLKGIFTFVFGVILFVLILGLSLVIRTKKFVEQDLVMSAVKGAITSSLANNELTSEQKNMLDSIVNDKKAEKVVERIVQNYLSFKTEEAYNLTYDDYNLLIEFLSDHINDFNSFSETKYTVEELKQELKFEDVKKGAEETFKNFEEEIGSNDVDEVMKVYTKTTSTNTMLLFIGAIIVCILFIALINWSFVKWMKVFGIDLIISGSIVLIVFILGTIAKNLIKGEQSLIDFVQSIDLSGFITLAVIEILVGILFIVLYSKLKNKLDSNKNNSEDSIL